MTLKQITKLSKELRYYLQNVNEYTTNIIDRSERKGLNAEEETLEKHGQRTLKKNGSKM